VQGRQQQQRPPLHEIVAPPLPGRALQQARDALAAAINSVQQDFAQRKPNSKLLVTTGWLTYRGWQKVAAPGQVQPVIQAFCPQGLQLLQLDRRRVARQLHNPAIQQDNPSRYQLGGPAGGALQPLSRPVAALQAQLLCKSGLRAACNNLVPSALRKRLYKEIDKAADGGLGLRSWFLTVHEVFVQEWGSDACVPPKQFQSVKATLTSCVEGRVRFAKLLIAVYNLLVRGAGQQPPPRQQLGQQQQPGQQLGQQQQPGQQLGQQQQPGQQQQQQPGQQQQQQPGQQQQQQPGQQQQQPKAHLHEQQPPPQQQR
jgi:hypothetical protein